MIREIFAILFHRYKTIVRVGRVVMIEYLSAAKNLLQVSVQCSSIFMLIDIVIFNRHIFTFIKHLRRRIIKYIILSTFAVDLHELDRGHIIITENTCKRICLNTDRFTSRCDALIERRCNRLCSKK